MIQSGISTFRSSTVSVLGLIAVLLVARTAEAQFTVRNEVLEQQIKLINSTPKSNPVILRLDEELERRVIEAKEHPAQNQVKWLASGFSAQAQLYARFGMRDLSGFAKLVLGQAKYPHVKLHRDSFQNRDLTKDIRDTYSKISGLYGKPLPQAPIYKVAFGYQKATNAAMEGQDRTTKRHIVILNRSALAEGDDWDSALIHETWHCFQGTIGKSLKERAIHEGMATYLTKLTNPKLTDRKVLFWTQAKWDAAESHRAKIIDAFMQVKDSMRPQDIRAFTTLNAKIPALPKAPDRTGYYVGLLGCEAWHKAHPKLRPADLLTVSADDILSSLPSIK